jgi:Tfp pilus assembly protein PilN
MKDPVQLFIDQRGLEVRALLTERGRVLATAIFPGPLDSVGALNELVANLVAKAGRKPEEAHLLIAADQVKFSTFRLQAMSRADVEKIVQRSIATATGEKEPIFRLTPLVPEQDKDVFLAEQIPGETVTRLIRLFAEAHLRLGSISTNLQSTLLAFAPHRDSIIQAQAIFDISSEAVTATFISATDLLHQETVAIRESAREGENLDEADVARALKRQLFTILNVIHGLYSQYMMANPLTPVEKVWLCGSGAGIAGLEDSLVDAMDLEVAPLDLLAGTMEESRAFTPLAGLIHACSQSSYVNFISTEKSRTSAENRRKRSVIVAGVIALLLVAIGITASLELQQLEKRLTRERSELQSLKATAASNQGRLTNLRFLRQLNDEAPPIYKILKEVAERLPIEIQLDGINLLQGGEGATLEILAVTRHRTPWENTQIFTSLLAALDGVEPLKCSQNPDIAMLHVGTEKLIKMKVDCRMIPRQGGPGR